MNKAPCKNCSKRYLGCHSNCEDYKGFVEHRRYISDCIRQANAEDEYEIEKYRKLRKIYNNKL